MEEKQKSPSRFSPGSVMMSWRTVFSYRSLWLFAAIVLIITYHAPEFPFSSRILNTVRFYGYGGVDMFLFASGIGCWFSLRKDPDMLRFLGRRFLRIMPVFLMSLLIWVVYCGCTASITVSEIIGNIFGHGTLAEQGNQLNWYFACLWVCYFSAPFFAALVERYPSPIVQWLVTALLVIFSLPFFGRWSLILWSRIPVFFLGICMAQASTRSSGLTWKGFGLALLGMMAGFLLLRGVIRYNRDLLWDCGGWWYPFILITPGACILLSCAGYLLDRTPLRPVVALCMKAGGYTLSLSLTHVIVFAAYRKLLEESALENNAVSLACACLLIVISSLCLEKAGRSIQRHCSRQKPGGENG